MNETLEEAVLRPAEYPWKDALRWCVVHLVMPARAQQMAMLTQCQRNTDPLFQMVLTARENTNKRTDRNWIQPMHFVRLSNLRRLRSSRFFDACCVKASQTAKAKLLVVGLCVVLISNVLFPSYAQAAAPSPPDAINSISLRTQTVVRHQTLSGFARVQPTATWELQAPHGGLIQHDRLFVGQVVTAGEIVGELGGPAMAAQRAQAKVRLAQAKARLNAAAQTVKLDRQALGYAVSTRKTLLQAELSRQLADTDRQNAQTAWDSLSEEGLLRAPVAGVITQIDQPNGSRVDRGMRIAQIEPVNNLQLRARFYTQDPDRIGTLIKPGMHGWFIPLDASPKIPVQVRSLLPRDSKDGALPVIFKRLSPRTNQSVASGWQAGTTGRVELDVSSQTVVPVPTRALVLSHAQWWVLVWHEGSWQRRAVQIGSSHGETTDVIQGLASGERVRVDQSYLAFHHQFSLRYQQPD